MKIFYKFLIVFFVLLILTGLILKIFVYDIFSVTKISNFSNVEIRKYVIVQKNKEPNLLDLVLFETPDSNKLIISRLFAVGGDRICLKNSLVYVNDIQIDDSEFAMRKFRVNCFTDIATKKLFEEYKLIDSVQVLGVYFLDLTEENYKKIKNDTLFLITPIVVNENFRNNEIYPQSFKFNWNEDNLGTIGIPNKGAKIPLNIETFSLFKNTILYFENKQISKNNENKILIDNKITEEYYFEDNYLFLINDKRSNYSDSRKYGPISENRIKGIVIATF